VRFLHSGSALPHPSHRRRTWLYVTAACAAMLGLTGWAGALPVQASARPAGTHAADTHRAGTHPANTGVRALAHYSHIFLIMEENNGYQDVIPNRAAPNLDNLARTFGVETDYFGTSPDSSESNYVSLLGGNVFKVFSDDPYWKQKVKAQSLISELDHARISWKAYLQSLPYPGYQGICYPARCNGAPDSDPLYVSKHDGIQNFTTSWNARDWSRQVPITELAGDLRSGRVPRFSYVVPDECHDMHGDPPYCLDSGNIRDPENQYLVAVGDAYLGQLVGEITHARFWARGNNAIVITYDNGDNSAGCCDANVGGGRIATIVVTSHGPRHFADSQPANHYSLLSTLQHLFGVHCLQFTCDTRHVKPIYSMFAVTGSKAIATKVLPERRWPTPTPPRPPEPTSYSPSTRNSWGWTTQRAQVLGTSDNSLGAIAGSSPTDIWAVGDFLPDAEHSNQDVTLTFAEHYNGTKWTVVRTPNTGPNFNSFYGLTAIDGDAWAVGEHLNDAYQDRALVESWNGTEWRIDNVPQPGSVRDMLFGASALSPSDVWVVGDQEGADGKFETLAEHWNGSSWTVMPTPGPGSSGNHLYAVEALSPDDVWAVGQQLGAAAPDRGLVEHWNGAVWSVVPSPSPATASELLDAVTVAPGTPDHVWVAGEADSPRGGGKPLVEELGSGGWTVDRLPPAPGGSDWSNLYGLAQSGGSVWAVGTTINMKTDNNNLLDLQETDGAWSLWHAPNPGVGSNIAGGITALGGQLWLTGVYDNGGSEIPLIEHRG
jgi:Phosphoesterase family